MSDSSDEDLMARYLAGDQEAFRALFERYSPRLMGLFGRQIRNDSDVRDLVQQTFLQFHRARHDFDLGAKVRPWLITIALNLKRRHFREQSRKRAGSLEVEPGVWNPASRGLERSEEVARVRDALAELSETQREVIELHWFEEMPFTEVARQVGASLSAVKVRAHRGYKRLREVLGGAGSQPA